MNIGAMATAAKPWLRLLRLHHPADYALIALLQLWGVWLGSGGTPPPAILLALLVGSLLLRNTGWLVHDIVGAYYAHPKHSWRSVLRALPQPMRWALLLETAGAALLLAVVGWPTLLISLCAAAVALSYPWLRRRTFLGELLLALAIAAASVSAFSAVALPNKTAWLVYTGAALWVTAWLTQYAALHLQQHARLGIRSLVMLFGSADRWLIATLQLSALLTLYLAGKQEKLGVFMGIGLVTAALLVLYQQWLMRGGNDDGYRRAYLNNVWFGIAVFCGIAFHYLCMAQTRS